MVKVGLRLALMSAFSISSMLEASMVVRMTNGGRISMGSPSYKVTAVKSETFAEIITSKSYAMSNALVQGERLETYIGYLETGTNDNENAGPSSRTGAVAEAIQSPVSAGGSSGGGGGGGGCLLR